MTHPLLAYLIHGLIAPDMPTMVNASEMCSSQFCSLSRHEQSIHLFSMPSVGGMAAFMLLHHFFLHYRHTVGIMAQHMTFVLDVVSNSSYLVMQAERWSMWLRARGVLHVEVETGGYAHSGDIFKRDAVNRVLAKLPAGSWLINADADEFFLYPCAAHDRLQPICGTMVDRLPLNITAGALLPRLQPLPSAHLQLQQQFPICSNMRRYIQLAYTRKWMLVPAQYKLRNGRNVATMFRDSHNLHGSSRDIKCKLEGHIDHYTMSAESLSLAVVKWKVLNELADARKMSAGERYALAWPYLKLFRLFAKFSEQAAKNMSISRAPFPEAVVANASFAFTAVGSRKINRGIICCPSTAQQAASTHQTQRQQHGHQDHIYHTHVSSV